MKKLLLKNWSTNLFALLIGLVAWQCLYYYAAEPMVFPDLLAIGHAAVALLQTKYFWNAYANTLSTLALAWVINICCISVALCICLISPPVRKIFERYCSYFMPLPSFILMPFIVLFFGFTKLTILTAMIMGSFWSMSYQMLSAFDMVKSLWSKHLRNLEWGLFKSITKVYIPAVAPQLIAISTMGWTYMWRVLITLEVAYGAIGGYFGVGSFLISLKSNLDVDRMYVILFLVALTGVTINAILERLAEKVKW